VRVDLKIIPVNTMDEVLAAALHPQTAKPSRHRKSTEKTEEKEKSAEKEKVAEK
jgi:hypothetical protein